MKSKTIEQIIRAQRQAAKESGRAWWFAPGAMRFFDTWLESEAFNSFPFSCYYFVTSEQFHGSSGENGQRLYTVRRWDEHSPDEIVTWGGFQQFKSLQVAIRLAQNLAKTGSETDLTED